MFAYISVYEDTKAWEEVIKLQQVIIAIWGLGFFRCWFNSYLLKVVKITQHLGCRQQETRIWGLCLPFNGIPAWELYLGVKVPVPPQVLEPSLEDRPWNSDVCFSHIPEIVPADQNLVWDCHCLLRYASTWDPLFWRGACSCTAV